MNISSVTPSSTPQAPSVQTLVASQQEALKEASAGITNDGDEPLIGSSVNRLA